jgi:hypothetical protein
MKAITVEPKKAGSALLEEIAEPNGREGSVLVEAIAVGVCGTNVEIVEGTAGHLREPHALCWGMILSAAYTAATALPPRTASAKQRQAAGRALYIAEKTQLKEHGIWRHNRSRERKCSAAAPQPPQSASPHR